MMTTRCINCLNKDFFDAYCVQGVMLDQQWDSVTAFGEVIRELVAQLRTDCVVVKRKSHLGEGQRGLLRSGNLHHTVSRLPGCFSGLLIPLLCFGVSHTQTLWSSGKGCKLWFKADLSSVFQAGEGVRVCRESDSFYNLGRNLVVVSHDFIAIVWLGSLWLWGLTALSHNLWPSNRTV